MTPVQWGPARGGPVHAAALAATLLAYGVVQWLFFPGPSGFAAVLFLPVALSAWWFGRLAGSLVALAAATGQIGLLLLEGFPLIEIATPSRSVGMVVLFGTAVATGHLTAVTRALRERERSLVLQAGLLHAAGEAIVATDLEGRIIYWNPGAERLYGIAASDAMGRPSSEALPSNLSQKARAEIFARLLGGGEWSGELDVTASNGVVIPVHATNRAVLGADGKPVAFISAARDLRARRERERVAARRSAEHAALAGLGQRALETRDPELIQRDAAALCLSTLGADRTAICTVAPGGSLVVRASAGFAVDPVGQTLGDAPVKRRIVETSDPVIVERYDESGPGAPAKLLRDERVVSGIEVAIRGHDRTHGVLAAFTCAPRAFDRDDLHFMQALAALLATALDAAADAAKIAESESRFRALAETSFEGIAIHERGIIREVNPAFARLFGAAPAELVGERLGALIDGARDGLAEGLTRDGRHLHLETKSNECTFEGRPARIVAVRDVTQRALAEQALRESETRFRTLFENVRLGLYRTTPDGRILLANPALVRMLGYSSLRELQARDLNAANGSYGEGFSREEFMRRIDSAGEVRGLETAWLRKDGTMIWVRESARAVRGEDGRIVHYEGTVEDVTERRAAAEAVRRSERKLRRVIDTSPIGILFADLDGEITDANEALLSMLGYTRADLAAGALRWDALTPPEYAELDRGGVERLHATGVCLPFEKEYYHKDGSRVPVMIGAALLDDEPERCVAFILDIRERKQVERALQASEARKAAILEAALDCVITIDEGGRILEFNAAAERAFGYARDEAIGHEMAELMVPAEMRDSHRAGLARYLASDEPHLLGRRVELTAQRRDGTQFPVELAIVEVPGEAGTVFTAFLRDLTDLKALEAERASQAEAMARNERLSALGTLVAGVAHEINNPLTYLAGNIELALLDIADARAALASAGVAKVDLEQTRLGLESALGGAERIAGITRALKAVVRQHESAERERVDLRAVVDNVEALLRVGVPDGVSLQVERGPPVHVWANAAELHQVVLNLARNAFDAVESIGGGTVRLRVERAESEALVTVADDGPGIPPEVLPRIFTPFYTTKVNGTGLGLSIVHGIVKDHGGEVSVASQTGKGTSFTLRFPLGAAPQLADGRAGK